MVRRRYTEAARILNEPLVLTAAATIIGRSCSTSQPYKKVTLDDVAHTLHVSSEIDFAPEASFQMARI